MSRHVNVIRTGRTQQEDQAIITEYLEGEGFKHIEERGERVWRKGTGALANPQFIKAEAIGDGTVRVEAWTAGISLLPGIYGGELDPMQGVYGAAIKAALKPRVLELERRLGGAAAAAPQTVAAGWYADPTGRHEQRYWDGSTWSDSVADGGTSAVDPFGGTGGAG
ncbi:MAG: DUF2510 domain-containing protein [Coriobacteriia bacterium]|nr:DUF2510 domain-containing protein [Coriobacteriia bacterium]